MIELHSCPVCSTTRLNHHLTLLDESVSRETFQLDQCDNCGFILTNPQPENLLKYYQSASYISHAQRARSIQDLIYFRARAKALQWKEQLLRSRTHKPSTLLDYGCGAGDFLQYCSLKNWKVTGVEPAADARAIAAPKISAPVFESHHTLPEHLSYEAITLWHVLEHIQDLNEVIAFLRSKLDSSGTLFIAVPNHKSDDAMRYQKQWAAYDVPRHLWHFSQATMSRLMSNHHLQVIDTIPMKLDAYYVSLLSEKYKRGASNIFGMISAAVNGFSSNRKASTTGEYSSLIYVIKHTAA